MDRHRSGLLARIRSARGCLLWAGIVWVGLAGGCRTDPAIIALERENRDLEDEIYALQDLLDRTQDELEACRKAKSAAGLAPRAEEPPSAGATPAEPPPIPAPQRVPLPVPRIPEPNTGSESPSPSKPTPPKLPELPKVELPQNALPPGQLPSTLRGAKPPSEPTVSPSPGEPKTTPSAGGTQPPPAPPKPSAGAATSGAAWQSPHQGAIRLAGAIGDTSLNLGTAWPAADNRQVRRITLDRVLTGGWNRDASPGDEGLSVLIEPRDAQGHVLPAPAVVLVELVDPALPGDRARIARWNLSPAELATTYRRTHLGQGFHLRLPWPAEPPKHDRLELFVRYTTDDGRRLEAQLPVHVSVPPGR